MAATTPNNGHTEVNAAEVLLMMSAGWNAPSPRPPSMSPVTTSPSTAFPSAPLPSAPLQSSNLRPRRVVSATLPTWTDPPSSPSSVDEPRQRTKSKKSGIKDAVRKRVSSLKRLKLPRASTSSNNDMKKTGKKLLERLAVHLDLSFLDKVDGASALTPEQFAQLGLTEEELVYYHSRAERDKTKALFKIFFCQRESLPIVPSEMACKRCKNDSWCCYLRKEMAHPRRGRKMKSCAGCHASKAECIWPNKQNEAPDYNQVAELNKSEAARATLPTPRSDSDILPRLSLPPALPPSGKKKSVLPTPPPDSTPLWERGTSRSPGTGTSRPMSSGLPQRAASHTPTFAPSWDGERRDLGSASSASPLAPASAQPHLLAPSPTRPIPRFLSRASSPADFHAAAAASQPSASSPGATSSKRDRSTSPDNEEVDRRAPPVPKRRRTVSPSARVPEYSTSATHARQSNNGPFWAVAKPRSQSRPASATTQRPTTESHHSRSRPTPALPPPQPTSRFLQPASDEDIRTLSRRGYNLSSQVLTPRLKCMSCQEQKLVCAFVNLPPPCDNLIPLQACIESAALSRRSIWRFPVSKTTGMAYLSAQVIGSLLPPTLRAIEEAGAWCDISKIQKIQDDDIATQLSHGLEDTQSFLSAFEVIHPHLRGIAPSLGLSLTPRPIAEGERYLLAQGVNQRARAVHLRSTADGLDILKAVERICLSEITPDLAQEVVNRLLGWNGKAVIAGDKVIRLLVADGEIGAAVERGGETTVYGHKVVLSLPEFSSAHKIECKRMEVMAVFRPEGGSGTRHWCASVIAQDQVLACEVLEIARRGGVEEVLRLVGEARRREWCETCNRLPCVC